MAIQLPSQLNSLPFTLGNTPGGSGGLSGAGTGASQTVNPNQLTNPNQQSAAFSAIANNLRNATGGQPVNVPGPGTVQNASGMPSSPGKNVNEFQNGWRWDGHNWQPPAQPGPPTPPPPPGGNIQRSFGLPPTLPPALTQIPKSIGGAAAPSSLLSSTNAGTSGTPYSAIAAQNGAFGPAKGVQASAGMATSPSLLDQQAKTLSQQEALVKKYGPAAATILATLPLLATGVGEAALPAEIESLTAKEGLSAVGEQLGSKFLPKLIGTGLAGGAASLALPVKQAQADLNLGSLGTPQALTTPTGQTTNMATMQNLSGHITDPKLQTSAISQALQDPSKMQGVISSISNPQGLQTVNSMIDQAQKSGDMNTVRQLANLHDGITKQLTLIDQLGRAMLAQAQGFGTPNAPGVTAARMPMVQQGVGQALTSPVPPAPNFSQNPTSGQSAQMLPPNLPTAPVQQSKPPIYPFMGQ